MIITDGNTVVIDVEARFTDSMSAGMGKAQQQADRFEKSMNKRQASMTMPPRGFGGPYPPPLSLQAAPFAGPSM